MKNATQQARLTASVRGLTKDFHRLRVRVESYRGPIGDSLAAAFWELILESPMCLREMRRICIGRQMALSDEETSSCSSDSDRSSSQSTQDHGFVRRRAVHHQRARRDVRVPLLPLGVRADPAPFRRRVTSLSSSPSESSSSEFATPERIPDAVLAATLEQSSPCPPAVENSDTLSKAPSRAFAKPAFDDTCRSESPPRTEGPMMMKQSDLNSPECVQTKTSGPAESSPIIEGARVSTGSATAAASLSDLPPELRWWPAEGERAGSPGAYQDLSWMRLESPPKAAGSRSAAPSLLPPPPSLPSFRSQQEAVGPRVLLITEGESAATAAKPESPSAGSEDPSPGVARPSGMEAAVVGRSVSPSAGEGRSAAVKAVARPSEESEEDGPRRSASSSMLSFTSSDNDSSSSSSSSDVVESPVRRPRKRRCGGKRVRIASPAAEEIPRRRLSLIEQGVTVEAFNTELSDIFGVEVKPPRSGRYLRWFDRRAGETAGPSREEMRRAQMPLHRKIFFLMEQQSSARDLPEAPAELLAGAFGKAKLASLEEDAVVAWVATQDPTRMTHRICAAAVVGCNGRCPGGGPATFVIRLFATAKEVSFGRRKAKVRGYDWGKLLLREIEHHLVAPRNSPHLLVESVADAWRYWAKLGFELRSSRGAASSGSEGQQLSRYNETLIGVKPVRSFRRP
ncbi:hypothetical protein FOZ61_004202 [Perkinsus olseni]|uniref:Uncharacterized protein n=1 Tax=Perkinsus olseni TaxID=32597 RepID=A0A7J6M2C9_PEROL|nr:hypothetical protein FOZ61_004202 [Perkinsus olseni]KAF4665625.1 hypothetical protein FOL46_003553 [Perkinsus olseni]